MKEIYQENIEMIKYLSNNSIIGLNPVTVKSVIKAIYKDPDVYDRNLYEHLKTYFFEDDSNVKICKDMYGYYYEYKDYKLSLDGINGWKPVFNLITIGKNIVTMEDINKLIDEYKILRSYENKKAYLLWPSRNKNGEKLISINQKRGLNLYDRIDWTLYEIKKFYDNTIDHLNLKESFEQEVNKKWLIEEFGNFKTFVNKMHLDSFVDNTKENIYNLGEKNYKEVKFFVPDGKPIFTAIYWENIKEIIKESDNKQ